METHQITREINPDSNRSTIVIGIFTHGQDFTTKKLPETGEKTLIFTLANKNKICSINNTTVEGCNYSYEIVHEFLKNKLQENVLISDIMDELTKNFYEIYQVQEHCTQNILEQEENIQILDALPNEYDMVKQFGKEEKNRTIEKYKDIINDYKSEKIAKCRVINNDRYYTLDDNPEVPGGIVVLDVRYPKTKEQMTTIEEESSTLGDRFIEMFQNNKGIRLSELLDIFYNEYGFDYVTVFDFACRTCDNIKNQIGSEEEEISKGINLKQKYKDEFALGGKKTKTRKIKQIKGKRQTNKRKSKQRKNQRKSNRRKSKRNKN